MCVRVGCLFTLETILFCCRLYVCAGWLGESPDYEGTSVVGSMCVRVG